MVSVNHLGNKVTLNQCLSWHYLSQTDKANILSYLIDIIIL